MFPKPNAKAAKRCADAEEQKRAAVFRALIWHREDSRDRATGERLQKGAQDYRLQGDVCHLKPKGAYPHLRYETSNAILLSRVHHIASDGRGGYKLQILGDDANGPLTFRMTDGHGTILWERTTSPRRPLVETVRPSTTKSVDS